MTPEVSTMNEITTPKSSYKVGDVVTPDPNAGYPQRIIGKPYVIVKVPVGARGVNYKAAPCDADGKQVPGAGLSGPAWALKPFSKTDPVNIAAVTDNYVPNPPIGALVRVTGRPLGNVPASQVFVVFGEVDVHRVRITLLGGSPTGGYWRVASSALTVLDSAEVERLLHEHL